MKIASIGPETTKMIRSLGLSPTIEAKEHTADGSWRKLVNTVVPRILGCPALSGERRIV